MKFIFETGAVVDCTDETIAKILRTDARYKEQVEGEKETPKKAKKSKEVEK